ncbi:MAG: hypothetical protein ACK52C_00460 [Planctomycetia bacterium]|jgi:hypothetical protein
MLRITLFAAAGFAALLILSGDARAQGPGGGSLPFSNIYKRPVLSPYSALGFAGAQQNALNGGAANIYQNQVLPRLELERQQVEQMRQRKQIGGLNNQVQQIQRGTGMRQIDETIRPTGHASTFQNLSHFYPQR